ncbi:GNAT family N-acetyltransferase [Chondrinema litorale]|uniref:GNAT family N-acetyltransferase n=1 Tax=Chondrinema litorale TaxID=2994555 RepID=UPI002543711E|nr:GNAT family N-acetyltransferase [Chondrinema litorale]UZR96159.1 GNAT family N-acetyltransferase [Chondrinema litorale]
MNLTFKKATEADIDYLLWLRKETMNEHLAKSGLQVSDEEHLKRLMYQFDAASIIFYNGEQIGLLKLLESEGYKEIVQIQIEPAWQGKGLGTRVIETVIREANQTNVFLKLSVLKENKAKRLYEKLGFTTVSEDEHSFYMEYHSSHN